MNADSQFTLLIVTCSEKLILSEEKRMHLENFKKDNRKKLEKLPLYNVAIYCKRLLVNIINYNVLKIC